MRLRDKVAVVTGGSRGIGAGIAEAYAREGAEVVLVGRTRDDLLARQRRLEAAGGKAHLFTADVCVEDDVVKLTERIRERWESIDILVNAAGISMVAPTIELSLEQWHRCMNTNLTGAFLMCREIGRAMIASGNGGNIINIASIVGHTAFPGRTAYASSKGGILQLTRSLALEWAPHNVRVNSISPGIIRTELVEQLIREGVHDVDKLVRRVPCGRLGATADVAGPAVFLASSEAEYMTGADLVVDGGWLTNGYT